MPGGDASETPPQQPPRTLCRRCAGRVPDGHARCPTCGERRSLSHPELFQLTIAHLDCDAFYATVEKRDRPDLRDKPVIVGGGRRGVVSACCYVARLYGVRSAMPMFKALRACPDAVVIRPDMRKYAEVGRQVRALLLTTTPLVEPISIDEAFLDLTGTEALHGGSAAETLIRLVDRIERDVGITASVGLSYNKFLAKIASDLDKPRGFAVIGRAEAQAFLDERPVGLIYGVGKAMQKRLSDDGLHRIGQLREMEPIELARRYGAIGQRLARFARGEDDRKVTPNAPAKSVSAETTFDRDLADFNDLAAALWPLCETVSRRLKTAGIGGRVVTLKLKTTGFRTVTRAATLPSPTQLADRLFRVGRDLLGPLADGASFRLIGIGTHDFAPAEQADPPDLLDPDLTRRARVERAIDAVRDRLGPTAIGKGRGLPPKR